MYYALINDKGIETRISNEMLTLQEMQKLVGIEGESAYIEVASYRSFSDQSIAMICDEEFLRKGGNPTCMTIEGCVLHGQVLIVKTSDEDFDLLSKR